MPCKVDDDNGDISGSKVKFNVNITDNLGAQIYNEGLLIEGKTRGSLTKSMSLTLPATVPDPGL